MAPEAETSAETGSFFRRLKSELQESRRRLGRARGFVRKCFLSGGAASNPERTYHLEFSASGPKMDRLAGILQKFGLSPKLAARGVLYLKEADEIAECLKIMGATKSLLRFEEVRVMKQVSNDTNRRVNFEIANLGKAAGAALSQIESIKKIESAIGLGRLPKPLADAAKARLSNESASLEELGAALSPPLGKSGISHRMRKLKELAAALESARPDEGWF